MNSMGISILTLVVMLCVLSKNVFVYLVEVTFLLEIWMFATLDICIVISDSKFHQTQLTTSNVLSSSARS